MFPYQTIKIYFSKYSILEKAVLVFSFLMMYCGDAISQCADFAVVSVNGKCATLTWNTTPSSYPQTIILGGNTFTIVANANPADYIKNGSNGNGCMHNNNYNGDIDIATAICTYTDGVLTNESPLPISLERFGSQVHGDKIRLDWATASELNNEGFSIQKSNNGTDWHEIGWVGGAGTTIEKQEYIFFDEQPIGGANYYRLKQIDFDGAFSFSKTISENIAVFPDQEINVFPNPVQGKLFVNIPENKEIQNIEIFNQLGQRVGDARLEGNGINVATLENGMYVMVLIIDNQKLIRQFVVD